MMSFDQVHMPNTQWIQKSNIKQCLQDPQKQAGRGQQTRNLLALPHVNNVLVIALSQRYNILTFSPVQPLLVERAQSHRGPGPSWRKSERYDRYEACRSLAWTLAHGCVLCIPFMEGGKRGRSLGCFADITHTGSVYLSFYLDQYFISIDTCLWGSLRTHLQHTYIHECEC